MEKYEFRIMPDKEIKYSKEKNYSDFTSFMQKENLSFLKEEKKIFFFIVKNNKIYCYDKTYAGELYNKILPFFKNSDKEKYSLMSTKINFDILIKDKEDIYNIIEIKEETPLKDMLICYSELVKKVISLLKEDNPSVAECYILAFENNIKPILQRFFLKNEKI